MSAKLSPLLASERIAIVAPAAEAIVGPRAEFVFDTVTRGHRVLSLTPPAPGKDLRRLKELGVQHRVVDLEAANLRLLNDWKVVSSLVQTFKDWQPNIVVGIGLKALVAAAIAGERARVRRVVSLCNGLPPGDMESVGRRRFLHAMKASDAVVFHNGDDHRRLMADGLLPHNLPYAIVPGSGVNLKRFNAEPLPPATSGLTFLMLARLERSRGVLDYAAAAASLKQRAPTARFLLAGPRGREADAVAPEMLDKAEGAVEFLGALEDVRPALAGCHVFVYPAYGEGMPPAVLEALATGRPVITTNTPGCRDAIDEKVSGCLVPAGNVRALAEAMESFLRRPDLLPAMSRAARLKAERRFDAVDVNRVLSGVLGLG